MQKALTKHTLTAEITKEKPTSMQQLMELAKAEGASDLHITNKMPPVLRVKGALKQHNCAPYTAQEIQDLFYESLTPKQIQVMEQKMSVDLAITARGVGRFRVAGYMQRGAIAIALRLLADGIPSFGSLGLPPSLGKLPNLREGLVLVTGVTGSGKSTTLATIIDEINNRYNHHIFTVEDPIEYVHDNNKSMVNQRELYTDVPSFSEALRDSLRADPDVILVGEMRDPETIRMAIMAAETGHLVFSTLHSRDCISTVNRIIGTFPANEQTQVRQQLSSSIKAVVSQKLLPGVDGQKRVPAVEIMFANAGIANLIRQGKDEMIYSSIETGMRDGMQTMEQSLAQLVNEGKISLDTALSAAKNPAMLKKRLSKVC